MIRYLVSILDKADTWWLGEYVSFLLRDEATPELAIIRRSKLSMKTRFSAEAAHRLCEVIAL